MRFGLLVAAALFVLPTIASAQVTGRCTQDDWITNYADYTGRNGWARKCGYISATTEYFLNAEGMYVIFSNACSRGCQYYAPVREADPCISGLVKLGTCYAGCYTPEQRLSFNGEFLGIQQAAESGVSNVTALSMASQEGLMIYGEQPIRTYVAGDTTEDIYVLKTADGRRLEVTSKHPMVRGNGEMVKAMELKAGDMLLGADGKQVALQDVSTFLFTGKVWNVAPQSKEKLENVLNAEGLLTGSVRFQNEWADTDFRVSLRNDLDPAAL